jgi:hypothetical protein
MNNNELWSIILYSIWIFNYRFLSIETLVLKTCLLENCKTNLFSEQVYLGIFRQRTIFYVGFHLKFCSKIQNSGLFLRQHISTQHHRSSNSRKKSLILQLIYIIHINVCSHQIYVWLMNIWKMIFVKNSDKN